MDHCQGPDRLSSEVSVDLRIGAAEWSEVAAGPVSWELRPNKGQNTELVPAALYWLSRS